MFNVCHGYRPFVSQFVSLPRVLVWWPEGWRCCPSVASIYLVCPWCLTSCLPVPLCMVAKAPRGRAISCAVVSEFSFRLVAISEKLSTSHCYSGCQSFCPGFRHFIQRWDQIFAMRFLLCSSELFHDSAQQELYTISPSLKKSYHQALKNLRALDSLHFPCKVNSSLSSEVKFGFPGTGGFLMISVPPNAKGWARNGLT